MNLKRKFGMVIFCIAIVTVWMCFFESMNIAHEDENQYVNKFTDEEASNELNTATTSMEITKLSDIYDGGDAYGVYVSGSYAYVADEDDGLEIIDISTPSTPVEVGQLYDGGAAWDVHVVGSYAYVADYDDGLEIIDISTPSTPVEVGQFYDGGKARGVYVSGSYAYVADYDDGLEIIDISSPSSPVEVGQFFDGGYACGVYVSGSYAYVADDEDGLEIIDISNPSTPTEIGQFDDGEDDVLDVYVVGSYAYVAVSHDGLKIIDISTPSSPTKAGQIYYGGLAWGVYVSESYAYVADITMGLQIINISTPSTPTKAGQFYDGGWALGVYVAGSYAYVADGNHGLEIFYIALIEHQIFVEPFYASHLKAGNTYVVNYSTTSGAASIYTLTVDLYLNGTFVNNIHYYDTNDGTCQWTVSKGLIPSTGYQLKFSDFDDPTTYAFSEIFEIYEDTLEITRVYTENSIKNGRQCIIEWDYTGYFSFINIELFIGDSNEWMIASNISVQDKIHTWAIPKDIESTWYSIKISDSNNPQVDDISGIFEIKRPKIPSFSIMSILIVGICTVIGISLVVKKKSLSK